MITDRLTRQEEGLPAARGRSRGPSRRNRAGSYAGRRTIPSRKFFGSRFTYNRSPAFAAAIGGIILIGCMAAAGMSKTGHDIDVAVMRFLLFYAGVFALIGLTAAVGIGLVATDRVVMFPGGRIIAQAVHRAVSFGAVGFLMIHIAVEVLAGRSGAGDAVVPFLDHGRT